MVAAPDASPPDLRHQSALASALARAVDAKDSWTRSHCETVAELCALIATSLGLEGRTASRRSGSRASCTTSARSACRTPSCRSPPRLDPAEYATVKAHATLGHKILSGTELTREAVWVLHHHERIDGGGYPARPARRPDPARVAHHPRRGRLRGDDVGPALPPRDAGGRRDRGAAPARGHAVRPRVRRRARRRSAGPRPARRRPPWPRLRRRAGAQPGRPGSRPERAPRGSAIMAGHGVGPRPRRARAHEVVRRPRRPARARPRRRRRIADRGPRAERRRQVDAPAHPRRPGVPGRGRGDLAARARARVPPAARARRRARPGRHRARRAAGAGRAGGGAGAGRGPARRPGARRRPRRDGPRARPPGAPARPAGPPRAGTPPRARRAITCARWGSPRRTCAGPRASCRAASASSSRWPRAWRGARTCCSSTSRRPTSTCAGASSSRP